MVSRRSAADYDSAVDSSEPNVGRYLQESIKSTPSRQRPNPSAISVISLHPVRNQRIAPFLGASLLYSPLSLVYSVFAYGEWRRFRGLARRREIWMLL